MEERRGQRREEEEERRTTRSCLDETRVVRWPWSEWTGRYGQVRDRCALFGVAAVIPGTRLDTMARLKNEASKLSLAATSSMGRAWLADSA